MRSARRRPRRRAPSPRSPSALEETTEVTLTAQIWDQGAAALGISDGLSETVVLDQTFDDVALVGHPLTIGNLVSSTSSSAVTFSTTTNTYTPYLAIGDVANPDPGQDETTIGQPYQDVLTTFPLSSQVVTGLFLDVTLSGPEGPAQTYSRTLMSLIPAASSNGGTVSVSVNPSGPPSINPNEIWSMSVLAGQVDPSVPVAIENQAADEYSALGAAGASATADTSLISADLNDVLIAQTRAYLYGIQAVSDFYTEGLASEALVTAYFARPRITLVSGAFTASASGTATLTFEADLRNDSIDAIAYPGQATSVVPAFQAVRGFLESAVETDALPGASTVSGVDIAPVVSATSVAQAAQSQGIPIVTLTPDDPAALDALGIDPQAKAGISAALEAGMDVIVPAQDVTIGTQTTCAWFQLNPTTGEVIGVGEDGAHQSIAELSANLSITIQQQVIKGAATKLAAQAIFSELKNDYNTLYALDLIQGLFRGGISSATWTLKATSYEAKEQALSDIYQEFFYAEPTGTPSVELEVAVLPLIDQFKKQVLSSDPPVGQILAGAAPSLFEIGVNELTLAGSQTVPAGAVAGTVTLPGVAASGTLTASWSTDGTSSYSASEIEASDATVTNSSGAVVGTGQVTFAPSALTPVAVSGNVAYQVAGQGSLSFYGAAESSLGASGDWTSYSATATGNVTMVVTTDALLVGGTTLPAGTYTIATASATIAGSGPSTSPSFSSGATITATAATVNFGAASGTLTVGGGSLGVASGAALDGFTGSIAVSTAGGGNDSVTLSGTAANVLSASPATAAFTTSQDAPVTFEVNLQASLADTYNLSATTRSGWTTTIDDAGNVTVTPAPGTQPGTYPVVVIAQSESDSNLIVQTTVNVTVTAGQPGFTLAVAQDPLDTLPFNGAQLPTAFQATVQNTGPAADTYTLTYSGIPAGFDLLNSATSLTVPAGATGIAGLYLMPTGQIPAVGTDVSLTVTATSTTDPSVTQTQTVSFDVPAIDAVTLTSDSTNVDTTPGVAAGDTITLTNAGNVTESNITLAATTSTGLTLDGLATIPSLRAWAVNDRNDHAHTRRLDPAWDLPPGDAFRNLWPGRQSADANRDDSGASRRPGRRCDRQCRARRHPERRHRPRRSAHRLERRLDEPGARSLQRCL